MIGESVTLRAKVPSDDGAILELARSLQKWFTEQGVRDMARDLATHLGLVAVSGNDVVGFITWNEQSPGVANLSWMAVRESLQHRGVGTMLLAEVERDLRARGYRTLEVSTVADTVTYEPYAETRQFYRSRGFADFRVDPLFFGEGEDRYDRLLLRKAL